MRVTRRRHVCDVMLLFVVFMDFLVLVRAQVADRDVFRVPLLVQDWVRWERSPGFGAVCGTGMAME